jgi:GNAT superfamily N-acetyltransferase
VPIQKSQAAPRFSLRQRTQASADSTLGGPRSPDPQDDADTKRHGDLPMRKRKPSPENAGAPTAMAGRTALARTQDTSHASKSEEPPMKRLRSTPLVDVRSMSRALVPESNAASGPVEIKTEGVDEPPKVKAFSSRTTRAKAQNPHAKALFVPDYREGKQADDIAEFIDSLDPKSFEALWPGDEQDYLGKDGKARHVLADHLKVFVARDRQTDKVVGLAWYENSTSNIKPEENGGRGIPKHQIIETSMVVHQNYRSKDIGKLLTEERFSRIILKKDDEDHRYMLSKIFDFNEAQLKRRRKTKEYTEIVPELVKGKRGMPGEPDQPDRVLRRFLRDLDNQPRSAAAADSLQQAIEARMAKLLAPKELGRAVTRNAKQNSLADPVFLPDYAKGESAVKIAAFMDSVNDEVYAALMGTQETRTKWLSPKGKVRKELPDGLKLFAAQSKDDGRVLGLSWYRKSRQEIPAGEAGPARIPKDRIIETAAVIHQDAKSHGIEELLTEARFQRIVLKKDDEHFRYVLSCVYDHNVDKLAERRGMHEYVELPSRGDGIERFLRDLDIKR